MLVSGDPRIEGFCDPAFAAVAEAFEANFRSRGELGGAVCIYKDGIKRVDLWGGWSDAARTRPWREHTIVSMMSVSKGMAALCVWMLVDRGLIDVDTPVAHYWPEFAGGGKGGITVRMLLGGRAGVLYCDHAKPEDGSGWAAMVRAYELQEPEWQDGAKHAYHSASCIYLLGELVRKVDGRPLDVFLAAEVTGPLDAEYGFGTRGTPAELVAELVPNADSVTLTQTRDPSTKMGRAWRMRPGLADGVTAGATASTIMPSTSGYGNARAVARVFAALADGGSLDGVRLVSPGIVDLMREQSWHGLCEMTDRNFRYGHGFFLNEPLLAPMGTNPRSFGHPGAGGALGFADPENRIAFSYSPSLMCAGAGLGERCAALSAAAYA